MNNFKVGLSTILCAATLGIAGAASASVLGSEVTVRHAFPDVGSTLPGGPFTYTVEAGTGDIVEPYFSNWYSVDIEATSITVQYLGINGNPNWTGTAFNGLVVDGLDWNGGPGGLTGASLSTSVGGFDPARLSFDTDSILLNFQGLTFASDASFEISLFGAPATVPLPAGLPLLLAGMGGLVALRRRNKTAA